MLTVLATRRRRSAAVGAAVAALAVAGIPAAGSAAAAAPPQKLYACITTTFKTLNLSTKNGRCASGQIKVSWNVEGTPGPRGPKGARGVQGAKGDAGTPGAKGDAGAQGPQGPQGATGPAGSPDTPAQVLAKLLTVDGSGSGLDADLLDGQHGAAFQQRVNGSCATGRYVRAIAADGSVTCGDDANSGGTITSVNAGSGLTGGATSGDATLAVAVPLNLTQPGTGAGALTASNTSGSSGSPTVSASNSGVGDGVYASATGGNAVEARVNSISAAALIGRGSSGEVVVGIQDGGVCGQNIGKCNGIGAVVGRMDGQGGYGVRGFATNPSGGTGVIGQAGISGGTGTGVRGENVNAANSGNGVEGVTNGSGAGIFGQGTTAGLFNGNVTINGNLTVTGTKSGFHIDDPRAPTLRTLTHTPVETDAMTVVYTGNVVTDGDGRATVRLPSYAEVLAGDWRYQLTPIGRFGQAIVEREVHDGAFTIRTQYGHTKVSWSVTGIRHDPQAVADGIHVVQEKRGHDRGRYLDPSLYGQPASRGSIPRVALDGGSGKRTARAAGGRLLESER